MSIITLPRIPLAHLPTPVEELPRLSAILGGPRLLVKRDDQTGLALGGNKTRKLEFLIAEAIQRGADTLITAGAVQSNHCRQTAAAAAKCGLGCVLLLGGNKPASAGGNLLLDYLAGAEIVWSDTGRKGESLASVEEKLRSEGKKPYVIPYGGSNKYGASGYVCAIEELIFQAKNMKIHIDYIIIPSSSGGTQAGLVTGAKALGFTGKIIGISIDRNLESGYEAELACLARDTAKANAIKMEFKENDFNINYDYRGEGYGIPGSLEKNSIRLAARTEGLFLDPVYTGRAMGGLIDMIKNNKFKPEDTILFWHTGGTPAIFSYGEMLLGNNTRYG